MIFNRNFSKFYNNMSINYFVFNKYSFFNIFEYKFTYFFTDRFFLSSFTNDFNIVAEEYSKISGGESFYKNLNIVAQGHVLPVMISVYNNDSIFFYEKAISSRISSFLINTVLKDKVFFYILKFFAKEEHKLFII